MTFDPSLTAKWGRFRRMVADTRREAGMLAALQLGIGLTARFARRQPAAVRDRLYELRVRDDTTAGFDTKTDFPELEVPSGGTHEDAEHYARTSPRILAKVFGSLRVPAAEFTFIDLGCGKGAALLHALSHGFTSVIGVELNDRLAPIADRNTREYLRSRNLEGRTVEIRRGDVVDFQFPSSPSVVFMYNPFGAETLTAVVQNLEESLRRDPREVVVVYANPVHRAVLDDWPLLKREPGRSRAYAIYRTRPPKSRLPSDDRLEHADPGD